MNARDAALRVLTACRADGAWSDGALKQALSGLDARDAALASRLCYGVLQNRMRIDFWLDGFLKGKTQPVVRDILRLAVYQLRFSDKIPASAAVNEAVEQAKRFANPAAARFVNGVLRSFLRCPALPEPQELSVRYSHPAELTALLVKEFGAERAERLLQSHNEAPETVLQVNTLKTDLPSLARALEQAGVQATPHPWLENCLTVRGTGSLERLEAFQRGWFYVQDAAARLAAMASGAEPGMRVLDCCAAPGGKSFAAALQMQNRGTVLSCDIHPHKLRLIAAGAERLGITCIETRLRDARETDNEAPFDVVICDVPCSGLGVIRKKPDIRYRPLEQAARLPELQKTILAAQAAHVRLGGVLIYSTCTVLRRENQEVVTAFLEENPSFSPETVHFPPLSGLPDAAMTTLLPSEQGTDGFFICKLRRKH